MPTRDLSQPLDADATVYPGDPPVELAPAATHDEDGYRVTEVRLGSHAGTHVDAPSHTEPDGRNLDDFDVGQFAFDARLVDCSGSGAREQLGPGALPDDLGSGTPQNDPGSGMPPAGPDADLLVLRTGWDAHWGTDRYFDHPYLSREAAARCAEAGFHVALDALSPDPSPSARGNERDAEPDGCPPTANSSGASVSSSRT